MESWILWLIAAVAAALGEVATAGFFLAPFAVGATAAAVAAALGAGAIVTWPLFAVITLVSFALMRPIARRHLHTPPSLRSGTAALVGRSATVVTPIDNRRDAGTVKLAGEVWTARALDDDDEIDSGQSVHVVEIRGATAIVTGI